MISIDMEKKTLTVGDLVLNEGDWVSVDGSTGKAYAGKMNVVVPNIDEMEDLHTILTWADEIARMEVWTNADNPRDALRARSFGAKGIGLCRTEHMFFDPERLPIMQRMILAKNIEDRVEALNELLPFQRADFDGLFEAMTDLPVIIRLVDPPLHEFLPSADEIQEQIITKRIDKISDYVNGKLHDKELSELENMKKEVDKLHESNPMMAARYSFEHRDA
jgi:pyruvate,orthophosphate dikinase